LLDGGTVISDSKSLDDALNKSMNMRISGYENYRIRDAYSDVLQRLAKMYGYKDIDALVADLENIPSALEQYHRLGGEVEARNAQARMSMTPEERRNSLASETEDVAREDQLFLNGALRASEATAERALTAEEQRSVEQSGQAEKLAEAEREGDLRKVAEAKRKAGVEPYPERGLQEPTEAEVYDRATQEEQHDARQRIIDEFSQESGVGVEHMTVEEVMQSDAYRRANEKTRAKMRKCKGWYDPVTKRVVVVGENHRSLDDVRATVYHEVLGHMNLRDYFKDKEQLKRFLTEIYSHTEADVRQRIAEMAVKNGYDIPLAVEEYMAKLAEKGFDKFTPEEQGLWQHIKRAFERMLNNFFRTLRLPDDVRLGDAELRQMMRTKPKMSIQIRIGPTPVGMSDLIGDSSP
jgi:hypothetical protein